MESRQRKGATLTLVVACALFLIILGFVFFLFMKLLGGNRQASNITDSGAIAAAKELQAVTVDLNALTGSFTSGTVPIELSGLGVNTTTGAPDFNTTLYNIYAYNRAAGAVILICANAESEGTNAAFQNAGTVVQNLLVIGNAVNSAFAHACAPGGQVYNVFANAVTSDDSNLCAAPTTAVVGQLQYGFVGAASGSQVGKSNVYISQSIKNSFLGNYLVPAGGVNAPVLSSTGVTSNTNATYASTMNGAEANDNFVAGYQQFYWRDILPYSGGSGFYAASVYPTQFPHLMDTGRLIYQSETPLANTPYNATGGTTRTQQTSGGLFTTAIASAVIGSYNNMYPASILHGFVLLSNYPSYRYNAQQATGGPLTPVILEQTANPPGESIFNLELYDGSGGGIDVYPTANPSTPDGAVFGVVTGPTLFPTSEVPSGNLRNQIHSYWNYNPATSSSPGYLQSVGSDIWGHNATLDPTGGKVNGTFPDPSNVWIQNHLTLWQPNDNARVQHPVASDVIASENITQASVQDMASINLASYQYCNDESYTSDTPAFCAAPHLTDFQNSFGDNSTVTVSCPQDSGVNYGGLTTLEYLKGLVITAWAQNVIVHTDWRDDRDYSVTIPSSSYQMPSYSSGAPIPSGSRLYNRNLYYANPADTPTIEFGTNGTPYALLQQIQDGSDASPYLGASGSATCPGNIDLTPASPLWNSSSSIQGNLLQRVQEIDPGQTPTSLAALLNTSGTELDLGCSGVIYFDTDSASPTYNTLVMKVYDPDPASGSLGNFPPWLQPQLSTMAVPDGNAIPACFDQPFLAVAHENIVNTFDIHGSTGDLSLSIAPFESFSGDMNTADGTTWTPSSGKGGLLGQLLFQQTTTPELDAHGVADPPSFTRPN